MVLEKLNTSNFEVLNKNQMVRIKGGEQTPAGELPQRFEERREVRSDGHTHRWTRVVYESYGSDETINGQRCYYDISTTYGDWLYNGWE